MNACVKAGEIPCAERLGQRPFLDAQKTHKHSKLLVQMSNLLQESGCPARWFDEMQSAGIQARHALEVSGFGSQRCLLLLYSPVRWKQANAVSYSALMNVCAKAGDFKQLWQHCLIFQVASRSACLHTVFGHPMADCAA